jgi:hypothetical protein
MRIDAPIITGSFSLNGDALIDLNILTTTGSNAFIGDQTITGSLAINDSATNFLIEGNSFGQTYLTAGGAIVLNPGYGGVEMVGSNRTFKATDITAEGFVSGEIRANNGVVSGSSQVVGILSSLNSYTGSNDTKWTSIGNLTGSYATTGSNTFYGTQVFSGSVFIATDLIVQGSSSIQYISASSVSIGTNIVNLNTATPSVRYAGISVQDSGSSAGVTGSMLWDSLCNRWIYSNPSTIGYSGGMLLSGPRASTLGTETTLTCNYIAKSGGGDHLYDSCIIDDGTTTCIKNNLIGTGTATIGSDIVLSAANPVIYGGTAEGGVSISNNTGGSYIKIFGASHATTPNTTAFINANSTVLTINALGNVGMGTPTPCSILHLYGSNPTLIIQNSATATVGNATNLFFRNLLSTGCIHFAGYIAGIQQSTSTNTGDLSFNTYNNGTVNEGIRITAGGCIGMGTSTPCTMLHVQGQVTIGCSTYRTRIEGSSAGTWINFGTLACSNFLGRIGTFDSSYVLDSNNGNISFRFGGTEKSYINSSGQACFIGSVTAANFYSAGTTGFWSDAYDVRRNGFYADGTNLIFRAGTSGTGEQTRMVIVQASGKVGIGCTTPQKNLTVDGCIGMSNTYNWGITNDNDANWGFRVCSTGANYSTFLSYAGDAGSDRRGGIYNQNGHWVAYGNCQGHFIVQCNLTVGGSLSGAGINGTLLSTTTQRLSNSTGGFANMVQKVHGAAGSFSQLVICVNLNGPGGWSYIINSGGTGGGQFQSGGGYINGPGNFSHSAPVGSGFTVTCHTCAGTDNVVRFVSTGGVHPFVSIQAFGSLSQYIDDSSIYIAYS